jgi:putative DNA methylase
VDEARSRIVEDGGGIEYAGAVATYLAFAISRSANKSSSLCSWDSSPKMEAVRGLFARQQIPMTWDFAEANPFGGSSGDFLEDLKWVQMSLDRVPASGSATVRQADAASRDYSGVLVSTDPPYYDNIGYSDLSDFFYVWLRRSLKGVYPDLLSTMLVPKVEELVANPHRHDGKVGARHFFEDGFRSVFAGVRNSVVEGAPQAAFPMTVWYAFKQSDTDELGEASTGWETLLEGMIQSGWEITSTWPNRSELSNRMIASGANALASSIVLSLRPRSDSAPTTDRRGFIGMLESELPDALRKLQQGQIAPVDLPQAAIGPGMAVFSRYSAVLEPDGTKMTVRAALARINEILDQVLNEQEGDFDATSRFAIAWYRQHGYGVGKFGDADNLARARNTSVQILERDDILRSRAGNVELIKPADLPRDHDILKDSHTSNWEALHHLIKVLEQSGIVPAGNLLQTALTRADGAVDSDLVKELAHLLFRITEGNGWTRDALSFNTLVTSWPEILDAARQKKPAAAQGAFDFDEED